MTEEREKFLTPAEALNLNTIKKLINLELKSSAPQYTGMGGVKKLEPLESFTVLDLLERLPLPEATAPTSFVTNQMRVLCQEFVKEGHTLYSYDVDKMIKYLESLLGKDNKFEDCLLDSKEEGSSFTTYYFLDFEEEEEEEEETEEVSAVEEGTYEPVEVESVDMEAILRKNKNSKNQPKQDIVLEDTTTKGEDKNDDNFKI